MTIRETITMTAKDTLIQEDGFGIVRNNVEAENEEKPFQIIRRFTMTNKNKASVRLITWGAGIQSIKIPNKQAILGDLVLGFDNIDGYLKNRYIGRITNHLSDNKNYTSGDFNVIDNVNWDSYVLDKQLIMSYLSRSRDEKYPAAMLIQVKYSWTDENELKVNIRATATATIDTNITSYCPMNLAGHGMGPSELKNHVVTINADNWNAGIRNNLPTFRTVECTLLDLRNSTKLKNRLIKVSGGGYNHNFRINSPSIWCYRFHGRVFHPGSGRFLELYSDQPSLQFETANDYPDPKFKYLPDLEDYMWGGCGEVPAGKPGKPVLETEPTSNQVLELRGKDGISYKRHGAFVLSPQNLPTRTLYPGKIFVQNMTYKFGSKND